jgi:hypothetical protein
VTYPVAEGKSRIQIVLSGPSGPENTAEVTEIEVVYGGRIVIHACIDPDNEAGHQLAIDNLVHLGTI